MAELEAAVADELRRELRQLKESEAVHARLAEGGRQGQPDPAEADRLSSRSERRSGG